MPPAQQPAPDFGAPIPGQPQLMLDTEQARGLLHRQDASLVSVLVAGVYRHHQRLQLYQAEGRHRWRPLGPRRERLHAHGGFP